VFLKLSASRTYAAALLSNLRAGRIDPSDLHPMEGAALGELGLLRRPEQRQRHLIVRTVTGGGRFARTMAMSLATAVVWFTFVAQIFIGEFFHYHPLDSTHGNFLGGWLNQPLVQLPWFNYTPGDLRERVRTGESTAMSADREAAI
jgi:hypothetical protein